jgi:hypothetical protein
MNYRPSTNFVDRSNARNICIKCKGTNDTGYTHCKPCADALEVCETCSRPMTDAQIKFSKSAYGKLLCYNDQPAQIQARELARGGGK